MQTVTVFILNTSALSLCQGVSQMCFEKELADLCISSMEVRENNPKPLCHLLHAVESTCHLCNMSESIVIHSLITHQNIFWST